MSAGLTKKVGLTSVVGEVCVSMVTMWVFGSLNSLEESPSVLTATGGLSVISEELVDGITS